MNRKPIFDAVRSMIGGHFTEEQVAALDLACDLAEASTGVKPATPKPQTTDGAPPKPASAHRLGALSQKFESAAGGPGTVSSGTADPGGVSYGTYQLSSKAGTLTAFMKAEGSPWAASFGSAKAGSAAFSARWKEIAKAEPDAFGNAQHAFIERTHYRPAVAAVLAARNLDLDARHDAVRDATWSIAVQHSKSATILVDAVNACDLALARTVTGYDRRLVEEMYKRRIAYVAGVAENKNNQAEKAQLISITKNRYPAELADALKMFNAAPAAPALELSPAPGTAANADGTVDGNAIAAANGVRVKSAAVKISKLHAKMEPVIVAVAQVARDLGLPTPVITSGNDSKHMKGSLHYKWCALDFRGNNVSVPVGKKVAADVAAKLGADYDVVFETFMSIANNHLHVEYDPK